VETVFFASSIRPHRLNLQDIRKMNLLNIFLESLYLRWFLQTWPHFMISYVYGRYQKLSNSR